MKQLILTLVIFLYSSFATADWPPKTKDISTGWPSITILAQNHPVIDIVKPVIKPLVKPLVKPKSTIRLYFFTLGQSCPPCMQLEPLLQDLYREGWDIVKVDVNENMQSYQEWKIEGTPTLLILEEDKDGGRELSRFFGGNYTKKTLKALMQKFKVRRKITADEAADRLSKGGLSEEESKVLGDVIDKSEWDKHGINGKTKVGQQWSMATCQMYCSSHGSKLYDVYSDGSWELSDYQPLAPQTGYSSGRRR
jgi:thiol-disulfide isomerase/thioredoxin